MPQLSEDKRNEIARLYLAKITGLICPGDSKNCFEILVKHFYKKGLLTDSSAPAQIIKRAKELKLNLYDASDFVEETSKAVLQKMLDDLREKIKKEHLNR